MLTGQGVSPGRAAAPAVHLVGRFSEPLATAHVAVEHRVLEVTRIAAAGERVAVRFRELAAAADAETSAILEASALMAIDPELRAAAEAGVRDDGRTAERAVWDAAAQFAALLESLGGMHAERAADVRDVRDRIVADLLGVDLPGVPRRAEPFVLVARDLAPADTVSLASSACVGIVTQFGGPTSHTAIIARALGLPAIVGMADIEAILDGEMVLIDGSTGAVDTSPSPEDVATAVHRAPTPYVGDAMTADGIRIPLLANIGGAVDARAAAEAGADGVGLFRTEFCFLDRQVAPDFDEQVAAYRSVLAAFPGQMVIARTLDAGSDKPLPFVDVAREQDEALGFRGLRVSRRDPALLDTQLAALAAAGEQESVDLRVMAPMVSTLEETRDFARRARAVGIRSVGITIETPAAAMTARELIAELDFVSIGTNDLTQYTMAADRHLGELSDLVDVWQPAVLRLIALIGEAGLASGKPVGVCGEAAADPALAPVLVGLGATELSMSARALGDVAAALAVVDGAACTRAARAAIAAPTAAEARAAAVAILTEAASA
ncbi:phosphoenolpyruvate--protein phosphotransferase [Salinibacterium sp. ZJ70]|uniref:phosphoenolpyruvate--protein phosphotransferase n=1 Tax=Salinibacterium sp. ZJ70 TaxID=2708084 RepID=UPI001CD3D73B|nr:phosphoenolpyruvate--protein phosphotransferase [Salinibacterium sp. ZJ70]